VVVTTLIVARIWYLSPREKRVVLGANFPTETGRAAIAIIIESGVLYLVVQVVLCIFFVKNHPAENIVLGISVQVYVRIRYLKRKSMWMDSIPQSHRASHRH
jgi:hypothetical protein